MAVGNFIFYNSGRLKALDGTFDFDTHTFKVALASASYTPTVDSHDELADLTNEVANGNGYTTGGSALSGVTLTKSTTTVTFDAADLTFTASGGDIGPFRYAVVYDDTVFGDPLVGYIDMGGNVTITNGTSGTFQWNASGIFTLSGASS